MNIITASEARKISKTVANIISSKAIEYVMNEIKEACETGRGFTYFDADDTPNDIFNEMKRPYFKTSLENLGYGYICINWEDNIVPSAIKIYW